MLIVFACQNKNQEEIITSKVCGYGVIGQQEEWLLN